MLFLDNDKNLVSIFLKYLNFKRNYLLFKILKTIFQVWFELFNELLIYNYIGQVIRNVWGHSFGIRLK